MPKDSKKLAAELPKKIHNHQAFMKQLEATFESMRDLKYAKQNIKFFPVPESPLGPNYGVRIPKIRSIARPVAKEGLKDLSDFFNLLEGVWGHGYAEDRFFVCHCLNLTAEEDAERTLEMILRISSGIRNWALCDTLATEALGPITVSNPKRIIPIAIGFMQSNMKWLRRFGVVSLVPLCHDKNYKFAGPILKAIEPLMTDEDYYVKMAVSWVLRDLTPKSRKKVEEFLLKWAKKSKASKNKDKRKSTSFIIRRGMKKLSKASQNRIKKLL